MLEQSWQTTPNGPKTDLTTSYCSYERPAQPGPIRTRLRGPCIAVVAGLVGLVACFKDLFALYLRLSIAFTGNFAIYLLLAVPNVINNNKEINNNYSNMTLTFSPLAV